MSPKEQQRWVQAAREQIGYDRTHGIGIRPTTEFEQKEMFPGQDLGHGRPSLSTEERDTTSKDYIERKTAEFEKAGVEVEGSFGRELDEETKEKFFQEFDDRLGHEAPEDFKKEFLAQGSMDKIDATDVSMKMIISEDGNKWTMDGYFKNEDGENVAHYTRSIDWDSNTAESEYFKVYDEEKQGQGFGRDFLKANVETYQRLGVEQVDVHANINVGGYSWARFGYVPTERSWFSLRDDIRDNWDSNVGNEMPNGMDKLLSSNDPRSIWAIADSPYGKDLLLNTDWNGSLDLTDRASMERFNAYVGKRH
jgi:hypothetical protein